MSDAEAISRCRVIADEIAQHRDTISTLSAERAALLSDLDKRHTRRALAALVGISAERITQILNTLRWGKPAGGLGHE